MNFDAGVNQNIFITISDKLKQTIIIALQSLTEGFNFLDSEVELKLKKDNEKVVLVTFNRKLKEDKAKQLKDDIEGDAFRKDFNEKIKESFPNVNLDSVFAESK